MNDIEKYFTDNTGNLIHKWKHYFDIYDRHFRKYRNKDVHVLEMGVSHGGSLHMWKNYFGANAKIYGVDINPNCKDLEDDDQRIKIFIGSQEDRRFLRSLRNAMPKLDILIDDGGHTMKQQIATFEELYSHIDVNGIYLCEDLHTSYWNNFGGGYKRKGSFIEYSKNFIDYINAWHSKTKKLVVTDFTRTTESLHYYDGILVVEKKPIKKPYDLMTGNPSIQGFKPPSSVTKKLVRALNKIRGLTQR